MNRQELIIEDPDLPFYHVKKSLTEGGKEVEGEEGDLNLFKFVWPRDLVIFRRIDSLCDLVTNPKPLSMRASKKRKQIAGVRGSGGRKKKAKDETTEGDDQTNRSDLSEEEMNEYDDYADEEDDGNGQSSIAADSVSGDVQYEEETESVIPHEPMEDVIQESAMETSASINDLVNNEPIAVAASEDIVNDDDAKMEVEQLIEKVEPKEEELLKVEPDLQLEEKKVEIQDEIITNVQENVAISKTEE